MAFRYPTGARALLIEETARRRRIESRIVTLLERAGFAEVVVPVIDFAEPYAAITDRDAARNSYRFTDRDGELISVRSDFTPMVARALAPSIGTDDLPLRVFYRGDVVRCEASRLGANRELFQIGAELIGDGSAEADAEMLQLVSTIASELVNEPLIVCSDVRRASRLLPPSASLGGIAPAGTAGPSGRDARRTVVCDEDDDATTGYYTGLRFWVYGPDRRPLFARGGRYDTLYGRFGTSAPAIGFTFTIDELED